MLYSDYSTAWVTPLYKITALERPSGEKTSNCWFWMMRMHTTASAASFSFKVFLISRTSTLPFPDVWCSERHTQCAGKLCESPFTRHRTAPRVCRAGLMCITRSLNILLSYWPLLYLNTKCISYLSFIYFVDFSVRTQRYKLFYFKTT